MIAHLVRVRGGQAPCTDRIDMFETCSQLLHMGIMIQIRNVPDELQRRLKARAAIAGMTHSDFLMREVQMIADRPSLEEMRARLARRRPAATSESMAEAVRAERES